MPDTETITYAYDTGGNLESFAGDKNGAHTPYLQSLLYDKFEQRTYLKLGNGVETNYTYNDKNRRLTNLLSQGTVAGKFQNLNYSYDNVGNILGLKNDTAIPAPSSMGGPTNLSYGYDDLYRLTSANGKFQSSPDKTRNYTLAMGYDDIHNIVSKTQADNLTNAGGSAIVQKATSYNWSYAYTGQGPHAPTHIGSHTFSYDADGNQLGWTDDKNGTRRIMLWDEDNRLMEVDDNGERSNYTYDANGERVIKQSRQGETVYVNQYYVVRNRSIVSKHLFAGTSRLVTRMVMGTAPGNSYKGSGGGQGNLQGNASNSLALKGEGRGEGASQGNAYAYGQSKDNPGQGNANGNSQANNGNAQGKGNNASNGNSNPLSRNAGEGGGGGAVNLPGNSEAGLENALANGQGNKYGIYKHLAKEGDTVDASGEIVPIGSGSGSGTTPATNGQSDFTYYYHPDHLGSTGYVTDASGRLYEHLEYFPFGETWVQEHSNTLRTPYLFTGKEFDQETGLYYFGARYYDPRTSVFQSVDPILGQYLNGQPNGGVFSSINVSLYRYAAQNPLRVTDPTGKADEADEIAAQINKDFGANSGLAKGAESVKEGANVAGEVVGSLGVAGELEAVTGKDNYSGKPLSVTERILAALPGGKLIGAALGIKMAGKVAQVGARAKEIGEQIAKGHAFEKHVLKNGEFKDIGIKTEEEFGGFIGNIISNAKGEDVRQLSNGRTAYWDSKTGTAVIHDPKSVDGGTAFRPTNGKDYFDGLR